MRLSSAQVKICRFPYVNFVTTSRFFSKFCIFLECHERKLLCTFLAQTVYTLLKRSCSICQIPYVSFEMTSQFLSKCCTTLQCLKITPLYYFSLNNLCFAQKEPIKVKHFETFECLRQNLSNSSCQF